MDQYQYLLLMGACLLLTLPLELVLGARVWHHPRLLLLTLLPIVAIYSAWDIIAIARGVWDYSPVFTSGIMLPLEMPIEELAFFLVVPICGLLTWEAVGVSLARIERRRRARGAAR